jgi:3D (Asp-Asp-Asp) domain-containing protein
VLNRRLIRKVLVPGSLVLAVVALYEVTILDSRYASNESAESGEQPLPGGRLRFDATAYCKGQTTASGVAVQKGSIAADPEMLPVGSIVEIDAPAQLYDGLYTVLDTGPEVHGRELDIYMWSCHDALRFGRREVAVTVLRLGWNPQATAPTRSFLERWLQRPRPDPPAATEQIVSPVTSPTGTGGERSAP